MEKAAKITEPSGVEELDTTEVSEISLIREAYDLDVLSVFGDDPYTIPSIVITNAWMKATPPEERHGRKGTHLWGYYKRFYKELNDGSEKKIHGPTDGTYRKTMKRLAKRGVVKPIVIQRGRREKSNFELTEYGDRVCETLEVSLHEQIRLEKWRRRARMIGKH